jgi:hypothetical protein
MNFLEKIMIWWYHGGAKPLKNYREEGEIEVEIWHMLSAETHTELGNRVTTSKYNKYPLIVNRPSTGKAEIDVECFFCKAPLQITIRSKESLMKIIKLSFVCFFLGIVIAFLSLLIDSSPMFEIILMIGAVLLGISVVGLYLTLPLEYRDKGISGRLYSKKWSGKKLERAQWHRINRIPMKDDES